MDQERIERIARAMCRAARQDPDKPLVVAMLPEPSGRSEPEPGQPAWIAFREEAIRFVRLNPATALRL